MDFDVVVIGGGVVGLAVAREAAEGGKEVLLLERHETAGRETSARNSEVIHGGMYYATDSLKARLSVHGRRMTYDFADKHRVHYKKSGKLIIAVNSEEQEELDRILARGEANGVENFRRATVEEIRKREPNIRAMAGLLSFETGIIDAHGFMNALAKDAENHGATLLFASIVHGLRQENDGWTVLFTDVEGENAVRTRIVVNAAGLSAQRIMSFAGLDADACGLALYPCKGAYFSLSGTAGKNIHGLVAVSVPGSGPFSFR
jgi:Predicted dehydrogenase